MDHKTVAIVTTTTIDNYMFDLLVAAEMERASLTALDDIQQLYEFGQQFWQTSAA